MQVFVHMFRTAPIGTCAIYIAPPVPANRLIRNATECSTARRIKLFIAGVLHRFVRYPEKSRPKYKHVSGGSIRWLIRFGSSACRDSKKKYLPINWMLGSVQLQARQREEQVVLFAQNRYVRDQVESLFWGRINELIKSTGRSGKSTWCDSGCGDPCNQIRSDASRSSAARSCEYK